MEQPDVSLQSVRLENVRGFRELDLALPPSGVTLIIGKNGTNKSTLLRAIAIGLASPGEASSLVGHPVGSLIRDGADRAGIVTGFGMQGESVAFRTEIGRSGGRDVLLGGTGGDNSVFVCGYGAGRGVVGGSGSDSYRLDDAVASLFDYRRELVLPELTLRRLQDFLGTDRYDATLRGIKRVLDLGDEDHIELETGGGVVLFGPGVGERVPLVGWADGYRLTFTWLLDLYGRALQADCIDADGHVYGVVLIDELDQHLHPALQAAIVPQLRQLLPRVQLIATTHSPLIALGAEPSDLVVLRRRGDEVVVEERVPDYRGYSAEDMLADDRLFDSSVYAPETEEQLRRYNELVAMTDRGEADERELASLAAQMRAQPLPPAVDEKVAAALAELQRHGVQA